MSVTREVALLLAVMSASLLGCGSRSPEPDPIAAKSPPKGQSETAPIKPAARPKETTRKPPIVEQPAVAPIAPPRTEPAKTAIAYRPSYPLRPLSTLKLQDAGLSVETLDSFRLVTDLPEEKLRPLVSLFRDATPTWTRYFNELPPARDKSPFHATGYVMADRNVFTKAGLLPDTVPLSYHGRQIGAEFWMNDQTRDYYRSHLLLHEATHIYMRHLGGESDYLPYWYLEGMAELIATHERDADGSLRLSVMPADRDRFLGWERIVLVQRDCAGRGVRSIDEITKLNADDFTKVESYAWCWALCRFLDSHPRYQSEFRRIARTLAANPFVAVFREFHRQHAQELDAEWLLFATNIEYGFDFERAVIEFSDGKPLIGQSRSVEVVADRGWQSSGFLVESGQKYRVEANGQFTLADKPRPWVSEANGVSLRYTKGQPLGRLLGCVRLSGSSEQAARGMLDLIPLGNVTEFTPELSGTLYLRLNDAWSELADNKGLVTATLGIVADDEQK